MAPGQAQRIGLEGYLDLSKFDQQVSQYNKGLQSVEKGLTSFASTLRSMLEQEQRIAQQAAAQKYLAGLSATEKDVLLQNLRMQDGFRQSATAAENMGRQMQAAGNNASQGFKILGLTVTDVKSAIDLASSAGQKVMEGFKSVYEFGKEIAQIDLLEYKFNRMAVHIGTSSDVLLEQLRKATQGTRSDVELMSSALDLMALGLTKTSDQTVRMSRVAATLGMDINQLVLAITNQSLKRFDQLGLTVVGFKEKLDALKATGLSVEDAFTEAFLQQAEEQIEKVGSVTDTTAGKFMKFEAKVKNAGDRIKMSFLPIVDEAITTLDLLAGAADAIDVAMSLHDQTMRKTAGSYEQYVEELYRAAAAAGLTNNIRVIAARIIGGESAAIKVLAEMLGWETEAQFTSRKSVEASNKAHADWLDGAEHILSKLPDVTTSIENLAAAEEEQAKISEQNAKLIMERVKLFMGGGISEENKKFSESQEKVRKEIDKTSESVVNLSKKTWLSPDEKEKLDELKGKLVDLAGQYNANAVAHDIATKKILFNLLEQQLGVGGLTEAEATGLAAIAAKWGLVDQASSDAYAEMQPYVKLLSEGKITAEQFANAVAKLPTNKTVSIYFQVSSNYAGGWLPNPDALGLDAGGANGLNMVVPSGYPNDSFIVGVSSGERVVVVPDSGVSQTSTSIVNNYYNNRSYNLGVNTMQSPSVVQRSFDIMRILNGE